MLNKLLAESVTKITTIVSNIQDETDVATNTLEEGYKEVERGANQIATTTEKFNGINHAI